MVSRKPHCITERRDAHGYFWRYTHSPGEPEETLDMAISMPPWSRARRQTAGA
jgi:hypothetical protein